MMPSSEQARQELEREKKELHESLEENFGTEVILGEELQEKLSDRIKEQWIIVAWLEAQYTAQLVRELRESIDATQRAMIFGEADADALEKIEANRGELLQRRLEHIKAFRLFMSLEDAKDVVKQYEHRMGR